MTSHRPSLRRFSRIASAAIIAALAMTTTVMTQTQNNATPSLDELTRIQDRWFFVSVAVIGLAAISTGWVSWMVYRAGNRVQDAIRLETARANERAGHLEVEAERQKERAANAERDAAEAKTIAGKAGEGTAKALADAAAANERAAEANKLAESFRLDIAQANERAAQANATAEKERLARLQLEAQLAPRSISPSRRAAMVAALKASGSFSIQIALYSDVTEVGRLSQQLMEVLNAAGWKFGLFQVLGSGGVSVQGIAVAVKKDASPETRRAATRLVEELRLSGVGSSLVPQAIEEIPPVASSGSHVDGEQIRVLIGNK